MTTVACAHAGAPPSGFLTSADVGDSPPPLARAKVPVATPATQSAPRADARGIEVRVPDSDARVVVRDRRQKIMCTAPCTAWVMSRADATVEIEGQAALDLPADVDRTPLGSTSVLIAHPKVGHPGGARALVISGIAVGAVFGALAVATCDASRSGRYDSLGNALACDMSMVAAVGGFVVLLIGAGFAAASEWPRLEAAPAR